MRIEFCASCGAPLEARWAEIVIECRYCGCQNAPGARGEPVPSSLPDDGRPRFGLGGRTYVVQGHLASGDSCELYRGRWTARLGELVVIKVLRARGDADLLRRGFEELRRLQHATAQGAAHFTTRLPQPIALGPLRVLGHEEDPAAPERLVAVYRWRSGFQHSLREVLAHYPQGLPSRVVVWITKRLLELLGWVHQAGAVHGAVTPDHILIHPRDHGAVLCGWGSVTHSGGGRSQRLPALSQAWLELYPDALRRERFPSAGTDLAMLARCALRAAGSASHEDFGRLPPSLGMLLVLAARGHFKDAWELRERLDRESAVAHGPPSYNPIPLPGWPGRGA